MKSSIFGIAVLMLFVGFVGDGYAQSGVKYPFVESGKTIVSRDGGGGIKTSLTHAKWTSSAMPVHHELEASNAVYQRFEVAADNCSSTSAPGVTQTSDKYTWPNAKPACAAYSQSGAAAGTWRPPTQREAMLIFALRGQLTSVVAFVYTDGYWSGTGSSSNSSNAWAICFFSVGYQSDCGTLTKTTNHGVRCIRDL